MDLIELRRTERRKAWIFTWLFIGACILTMVELQDFSTNDGDDEIGLCIEVLQDKDSYEDEDVEYCRRAISDFIQSKARITT